ncbi:MAG: quinol:cytochrome C oxidoreductase [Planctomycetota bacterium]
MASAATTAAPAAPAEDRRAPAAWLNLNGLLLVGGAAVLLLTAGVARAFSAEDNHVMTRFWHAYLLAASFVASLSLGGLFFVLAHHLTGGRWGTSLRRIAEIVAGTVYLSAALFLPIIVSVYAGSHDLYHWNDPTIVARDAVLQSKAPYLNGGWFAVRSIAYFAIWCVTASVFIGKSVQQDQTGEVGPLRTLSRLSGPCTVLFAVALNFAAFDWMMSLAPHWFSTMFGVYYFAGCFVGFLSLLILLTLSLQGRGVLSQSVTTDNLHDVAKLMYAFIVFWGYIAFSQFILIWYANVPEETEWYATRQLDEPTWLGMPVSMNILFILHLFIPFLGFMSSAVRRNKAAMGCWAGYLLVVHWLDLAFIILPGMDGYTDRTTFGLIGPMEIACVLGAVAMLLGAILLGAQDRWLLPVRDPRLKQSMTYHNH